MASKAKIKVLRPRKGRPLVPNFRFPPIRWHYISALSKEGLDWRNERNKTKEAFPVCAYLVNCHLLAFPAEGTG